MKKLVIVESPSKTKKISKFLGNDYIVLSSVGHVRDLPKSKLSIDVDNNFEPEYVVSDDKRSVVRELKKVAKESDAIYLATDPDREGEAIAWHIGIILNGNKDLNPEMKVGDELPSLKNKDKKHPRLYRVAFNSITKDAVLDAFQTPRALDFNLINAQQARRILDRLVGYKLSPLLWKKIRYGLSAGRVQSVAVRFVVERERERDNFNQVLFYEINGNYDVNGSLILSNLQNIDGKPIKEKIKFKLFAGDYYASKTSIDSKTIASNIEKELKELSFVVDKVEEKDTKTSPYAPFTTSSLQQSASTILGYTPKRTMQLAQKLYEAGHITYMRTDSIHIIPKEVKKIRRFIKSEYGAKYLSSSERIFKDKKGKKTQEAHEAIRPTDISLKSEDMLKSVTPQQRALYDLIRNRTLATQMASAVYTNTKIKIANEKHGDIKHGKYVFIRSGSVVKFDGYTKVYKSKRDDVLLPKVKVGCVANLHDLEVVEKQMALPPRYNESSLVKELESHDIGRPSTYASIVSTIQARGYVKKNESRQLFPTDNGFVVNDLLVKHFPQIVDVDFTADMEDGLDEVAVGDIKWVELIRSFYGPFAKLIEQKDKEIKKEDIVILEKMDEVCPECKVGKLVVRLGKYGKFISCDRYPDCKYARPIEKEDGVAGVDEDVPDLSDKKCPECGGELVVKEGRFGKFIACKNYPKCKYTQPIFKKIGMECPKCGKKHKGEVVIRKTKRGRMFYGCSRYPDCDYSSWTDPRLNKENKNDVKTKSNVKKKDNVKQDK